jgi:hypothetical protein
MSDYHHVGYETVESWTQESEEFHRLHEEMTGAETEAPNRPHRIKFENRDGESGLIMGPGAGQGKAENHPASSLQQEAIRFLEDGETYEAEHNTNRLYATLEGGELLREDIGGLFRCLDIDSASMSMTGESGRNYSIQLSKENGSISVDSTTGTGNPYRISEYRDLEPYINFIESLGFDMDEEKSETSQNYESVDDVPEIELLELKGLARAKDLTWSIDDQSEGIKLTDKEENRVITARQPNSLFEIPWSKAINQNNSYDISMEARRTASSEEHSEGSIGSYSDLVIVINDGDVSVRSFLDAGSINSHTKEVQETYEALTGQSMDEKDWNWKTMAK